MKKLIILFSILTIFMLGCKKEEPMVETDPQKAILGRWEIVESGNGLNLEPVINPFGYTEYLPDSIRKEYEYSTGNSYYNKYWIDDSLLYTAFTRDDGELIVSPRYRYQFSNHNNTLRLDIDAFAIINTFIYKRLK